jgi:hypothetical protein
MESPTKQAQPVQLNEAEPTPAKAHKKAKAASVVKEGSFEVDKHFYTKVLKCVIPTGVEHLKQSKASF